MKPWDWKLWTGEEATLLLVLCVGNVFGVNMCFNIHEAGSFPILMALRRRLA